MFPSISEYNQAIQNISSNSFSTLKNIVFLTSRSLPIKIYTYGSGSYAVVFKANIEGRLAAFRCFLTAEQETVQRSKNIFNYLNSINSSWKVSSSFLDHEFFVSGKHHPVVIMDWIEGDLLNKFVSKNINDLKVLTKIQAQLVQISHSLEENGIGHGDIQCGNVLVHKSENDFIIKLIDYDGMYVPQLKGKKSIERGRSEFQHPQRSEHFFNEIIDRFSFWVIITAIEALKYDKSLWMEVMQGGYNTLDNFLFIGQDFASFNNSQMVNRLYSINQPSLKFYLNKLNHFCNAPIEKVEKLMLYESNNDLDDNNPVSSIITSLAHQEQMDSAANPSEIQISSNPQGVVILTSTFERIGITPYKIEKTKFLNKNIILSFKNQTRQVSISEQTNNVFVEFDEAIAYTVPFNPQDSTLDNKEIIIDYLNPNLKPEDKNPPIEKEDDSLFKIFVIVFIIIVIIIAIIINNENKNSGSTEYSNDTAVLDSVAVDTLLTVDTTRAGADVSLPVERTISDSTVTVNTVDAQNYDDSAMTAEGIVREFLVSLNNHNYEMAWNYSNNPIWEKNGKEWFISEDGYGGIKRVVIQNISKEMIIGEEEYVSVSYYAESKNSKMCYNQSFVLKKLYFANKFNWMIIKMYVNSTPYNCNLER